MTGASPQAQRTTVSPRFRVLDSESVQSQPDTPHSGCLLRLALLPPTLSLFERPCVEGRIVRTGQSLGLGHEVIFA